VNVGLARAVGVVVATIADEVLITQSELSRRADVPQPQISRVFRGMRVFTLDELDRVCQALGVDVAAVVHDADLRRR